MADTPWPRQLGALLARTAMLGPKAQLCLEEPMQVEERIHKIISEQSI